MKFSLVHEQRHCEVQKCFGDLGEEMKINSVQEERSRAFKAGVGGANDGMTNVEITIEKRLDD